MKYQLEAAIVNVEALVQQAQANCDSKRQSLSSAEAADMRRSDGSSAQDNRHEEYMRNIRVESESAEKNLENAKQALRYLKNIK